MARRASNTLSLNCNEGKTDIRHTLHARPSLRTLSGNVTAVELLHRLGFSGGPCAFLPGGECVAREIPEDFNLPLFAGTIDKAFSELQEAMKLLFECGFYVERHLFGRDLPPIIAKRLTSPRGDGHTAPNTEAKRKSEDETFEYRFTWMDGADKGWTLHYRPKHLPLSTEISSLLSFLGINDSPECPEFDFDPCKWRFMRFTNTGHPVHGAAEIAYGWFDKHAEKFSPGLQKLLDAHATLATFGLNLLPNVRANLPPEVVQPPRSRKSPTRPSGATKTPSNFDVAISFAGAQREIAEAIATIVRDAGFEVFYDRFFPEQLWGKDLAIFFDDVFRKQSRFCLVVVSQDYINGEWTNRERQSAVERAINERGREYILPVKLADDLELPGVPGTVGYVSLNRYSIEQIAEMLIAKLA